MVDPPPAPGTAKVNGGRLPLGLATIVAGVVVPIACVAVDWARGQGVLSVAPAAILTLVALGLGSLLLSAAVARGSGAMAFLAGTLAASSVGAWVLALPLALIASYGAALTGLLAGKAGLAGDVPKVALLSALGLSTLSIAWVYTRRTRRVVAAAAETPGPARTTLARGILGAITLIAAVYIADQVDRRLVGAALADISLKAPDRWPAALEWLSGYPLCGKLRCEQLVCDRLYHVFGETIPTGALYTVPNVPPEHEALFADYLGKRTGYSCARPH